MKEIMYSLLRGLFFVVVTVLVCCVRIIGQQQTPQPDEFLVGGFIAAMHPEYKDSTLYSNYDQILECGLNSVWQYVKRTDPKNFAQLSQFPYIYAANDTSPNNALNQGNVDWISYFTHAKYFRWEAEGDENFPDDPGANRVGIKHNGVGHETADGWSCGEGTNGIGEYFIDGPHYTQYRRYVYTNRWLSNPLIYYNAVFRLKLVDPQEGSFEVAMLKVSVDTGSVDYGGVGEFPIDSLILTSDSLSTNYKEFTINYSYEDLMEECTGCSGHYPPPPGLDWIPMKEASNTPWIDFTKKVRFKVQKRSRVEVIVDYIEVYDGGRPYSIWENSFIGEFNYTQTVNRISVYNQDYDSLSNLEYYGTMDEPHTWDSFIPLKKVQHILDSINTGRDLLVHFYPGWENKRELVQNVLEKWFRIAQPKKLMFWYAPFSCWYETTEYCDPNPQEFTFYYLRKNLQHAHLQLPGFFVTLQTWGTWDIEEKEYSGYYKPTPAGLIAETMLALAHGTEGIFYEVYYSYYSKYNAITQEPEILVEGLVDVPENNFATTENWDTVKYLAARLEGILGETIMNIKYTATDEDNGYLRLARYLDYRVPTTDDSVKKDYLILETTNSGDTLNFHAGFFIDSTDLDNNYFLLANLITTGSKWVNIGLIPPVSGYANYRFRNVETEFDTTFHSTISIDKQFPSGEGYLYQVAPVVKYGGKLKYDETVTGEKSLLDSMIIEDGVTLNIDGTYSIYDNLTVYGDIVVSDGGLLDINPGVEIYFQNGATLTVYGELEAEGTQTDSIIFDGDDWGSITIDRITDNNQYHSALSYAKIRNGAGIQCLNGAELTIQNSLIEDCTQGIYIYKSEPIISSTDIINPLQNGVNTNCYGEAIRINDSEIKKDSSNPQYHQNQGIILGNSTDAEIFHNDIAGFYYGMYIGGGSVATFGEFEGSTYIPNNRVKECPRGIGVGWGAEMYGGLTEEAWGYNSIYDNSDYDIYVYNYSEAYAEDNYWGGEEADYYVDGTSTISVEPYLEEDPWEGESMNLAGGGQTAPGENTLMKGGGGSFEFLVGLKLEKLGKINEAINHYKGLVISNTAVEPALSRLLRVAVKHKLTNTLIPYLNNVVNNSNVIDKAILLRLSANIKMQQEDLSGAMAEFDKIAALNRSDYEVLSAKFSKLFLVINIMQDATLGSDILSDINTYTIIEDELKMKLEIAEFLLEQLMQNNSRGGMGKKTVEVEILPTEYTLYQNYPNPFNPVTTIKYDLPDKSDVKLIIYDILGEQVRTLVNEQQEAGRYEVRFDASSLASGVYLYRIKAGRYIDTKKMVLLR